MKIFYYTSTGNSLYIAEQIANEIKDSELISMTIGLKNKEFIYKCNKAIIISPVHCFGLPIVAFDFLEKLKLINCKYIYCIAVSGGGSGFKTLKQISELIKENGIINDSSTVKYISNYIKTGRNLTQEKIEKCEEKNIQVINKIIVDIKNETKRTRSIIGNKGSLSNRAWRSFFRGNDNKFTVNENCINCKICEKICPVNNITILDNKPSWSFKCVDCMGCINLCPKEAINLGKKTIKKTRYKNKYIDVYKLFVDK
ncbi:MAG: EFR1 family ferrodoxin [Sarcina sp.]